MRVGMAWRTRRGELNISIMWTDLRWGAAQCQGIEANVCEEQPFRSIRALTTRFPESCARLIQIPDLGTCPN